MSKRKLLWPTESKSKRAKVGSSTPVKQKAGSTLRFDPNPRRDDDASDMTNSMRNFLETVLEDCTDAKELAAHLHNMLAEEKSIPPYIFRRFLNLILIDQDSNAVAGFVLKLLRHVAPSFVPIAEPDWAVILDILKKPVVEISKGELWILTLCCCQSSSLLLARIDGSTTQEESKPQESSPPPLRRSTRDATKSERDKTIRARRSEFGVLVRSLLEQLPVISNLAPLDHSRLAATLKRMLAVVEDAMQKEDKPELV